MKKKYLIILIIILVLLSIGGILIYNEMNKKVESDTIPEGYISIFHGEVDNEIRETYIYKQKNNQDNYGFDYINVTKTQTGGINNQWVTKITSKGSVSWTDNVFGVAKNNNAYDYVTTSGSDKHIPIEQYMDMFIMN